MGFFFVLLRSVVGSQSQMRGGRHSGPEKREREREKRNNFKALSYFTFALDAKNYAFNN